MICTPTIILQNHFSQHPSSSQFLLSVQQDGPNLKHALFFSQNTTSPIALLLSVPNYQATATGIGCLEILYTHTIFDQEYVLKSTQQSKRNAYADSKEMASIIEKMVELFKKKSEDFKIIEMMKTYKEQFKNEKFVSRLVEKLTQEDFKEFKKSKASKNRNNS